MPAVTFASPCGFRTFLGRLPCALGHPAGLGTRPTRFPGSMGHPAVLGPYSDPISMHFGRSLPVWDIPPRRRGRIVPKWQGCPQPEQSRGSFPDDAVVTSPHDPPATFLLLPPTGPAHALRALPTPPAPARSSQKQQNPAPAEAGAGFSAERT